MEFRTRYDRIRVRSNAGSPFLTSYKLSVNDDGEEVLIRSGKDNIYQKIQAERDSCDLKSILARLSHQEIAKFDISHGGLFGDFTQVPKSIHDMRQRMLDADAMFKSLPVEVREKFDFSPSKYFSSIGTDYFNEVMSPFFETPTVKLEVKEENINE